MQTTDLGLVTGRAVDVMGSKWMEGRFCRYRGHSVPFDVPRSNEKKGSWRPWVSDGQDIEGVCMEILRAALLIGACAVFDEAGMPCVDSIERATSDVLVHHMLPLSRLCDPRISLT